MLPIPAFLDRARSRVAAWVRVPSLCAVCGAWPADRLCEACVARFAAPCPRCRTCARPLAGGTAQCGECLRHANSLDACVAAVAYAFPWAGVLAQFKIEADPGWATALVHLLRSAPGAEDLIAAADALIPIALTQAGLAARGFNQSQRLAEQLDARKTWNGMLLRLHQGPDQHQLGRAARLRNLQGAFAVEPLRAAQLQGRRLLLVDDVMTTGATLQAAAQVLRQYGAAQVNALVLARADSSTP